MALTISPADRELLELVGRHPFLTLDRLAIVLGCKRTLTRFHRDGSVYGFYVEYDRATMWARGYIHKFQAYYAYWTGQRFYHNVYSFPRVLVVTVTDAAEQRIARVARSVAVGQYAALSLLLTCQSRIDATDNPLGLLGPIWREPGSDVDDHRYWLPPSSWEDTMTETFLTVKEVACRLALGRTTVYELIAKRELTAIRIGRARRIPESALERWVAQQLDDQRGEQWHDTTSVHQPSTRGKTGR